MGIVFLAFPLLTYKKKGGDDFSYLSFYPFEAGYDKPRNIALSAISMVFAFISVFAYSSVLIMLNRPVFISALVFFIISLMGFLLSVFFGFEYLKVHLIGDIAMFLGEAGGDISLLLACVFKGNYIDPFPSAIMIIFGIIGIILLGLLFHPSIKRWAFLEKSEENGKVIYVRPKVNYLALMEWVYLVGHLVNMVLFIIAALVS